MVIGVRDDPGLLTVLLTEFMLADRGTKSDFPANTYKACTTKSRISPKIEYLISVPRRRDKAAEPARHTYFVFSMCVMRSRTRLEYPASLSYLHK